jgi:hypothetical protein
MFTIKSSNSQIVGHTVASGSGFGALALNQINEGAYVNILATTFTNSKVVVYSDGNVTSTTTIQILKNSTTVVATVTINNGTRISNIDTSPFILVQGERLGYRITAGDITEAYQMDSIGFTV